MRARAALYHHVQALFETHLRGLYRLDEALHHVARPYEPKEGERKRAFGREAEIVEVSFGRFELMLASPHEVPPLGRCALMLDKEIVTAGPLDEATFTHVGRAIREIHQHEEAA